MQLKIAVCDDEEIIRSDINKKLMLLKPDYIIDQFGSGKQLLETGLDYDIIFLDIEMPDIDGMKTADLIREKNSSVYVIFITSHIEFMPEAFKVKAFRFLNKPIKTDLFNEAIDQAEKEILNDQKIIINIQGTSVLVNFNDIVYFEAFGDGTYIHTKKDILCSTKPLRYWAEKMGEDHFFQTHKSYLVALKYIKIINQTDIELNYIQEKILVSRRKLPVLRKTFFEYIKRNAKYI